MDKLKLYHGTSSNRASKICTNGFRIGIDNAIFFAEEAKSAEYFALTTKIPRGQMLPQSFTTIIFDIPTELAMELGLFKRYLIGEYRQAPSIQPGESPYERILIGQERIQIFNDNLKNHRIYTYRWQLK